MKWIQEVRDLLTDLHKDGWWYSRDEIAERASQALAAIPDEPEMMKLLRWLREQKEDTPFDRQYAALADVEDYIWRKFGYKLEDEK